MTDAGIRETIRLRSTYVDVALYINAYYYVTLRQTQCVIG